MEMLFQVEREKSRNKINELRKKLYEKYLNISFISDNKEIVFNCLNCKKKVRAFIGSSLGYTLLCKECFIKKYKEYLKSKHMSFLKFDKIVKEAWIEFLKIWCRK